MMYDVLLTVVFCFPMQALQEEREARRQYLSSPSASPDSMADVIGDVTLASPSISPPISPDFSYTPGAPQLGYASPPFADVRSEREGGLGVAEPVAGEHGKGLTAGLQGQAGREEGPGAGKGRGAAGKVEEVEGNGKDGRREPCFAVSCFDEVAALSGRNLKVCPWRGPPPHPGPHNAFGSASKASLEPLTSIRTKV